MAKPATLTSCDYCGGPAHWTLDLSGEVWFFCKARCSGFMQVEIWPEIMEPELRVGVAHPVGRESVDTE